MGNGDFTNFNLCNPRNPLKSVILFQLKIIVFVQLQNQLIIYFLRGYSQSVVDN